MDIAQPKLTRRHYKRLRWYFAGGTKGATSAADSVDLDLCAQNFILRKEIYTTLIFAITPAGELALALENAREKERRAPHHELGGRLSQWLRASGRITWENIEFLMEFPAEYGGVFKSASRPDVFSMKPTYNVDQMNPVIHEVKVSRADFLSDIANPAKREAYGAYSEAFSYVCPQGMILPSEIPPGVGLLYEYEQCKFQIIVKPKRKKIVLAPRTFMNLILKPGKIDPLA